MPRIRKDKVKYRRNIYLDDVTTGILIKFSRNIYKEVNLSLAVRAAARLIEEHLHIPAYPKIKPIVNDPEIAYNRGYEQGVRDTINLSEVIRKMGEE